MIQVEDDSTLYQGSGKTVERSCIILVYFEVRDARMLGGIYYNN